MCRCGTGYRGGGIPQRCSTIWTIHIIRANHALALRTACAQFVVARWAKVEPRLEGVSTLRAASDTRLPQHEIQHDAERVGDADRQQRPGKRAHTAAGGVPVHIPDQQDVTPYERSSDDC